MLVWNRVQNFNTLCLVFSQVCLIGKSRCYEEPEEEQAEVRRTDYIRGRQASCTRSTNVTQKDRSRHNHHGDGEEICELGCEWGNGFQPREKTETVRNCAALPRDLVDCVVLKVAEALLGLSAEAGEEENTSTLRDTNKWNAGGERTVTCFLLRSVSHRLCVVVLGWCLQGLVKWILWRFKEADFS